MSSRARNVSCQVELDVRDEAQLVWSAAVAHRPELASEHLTVTVDGKWRALDATTSPASSPSPDPKQAPLPGVECAVPRIC